nr:class I SAM-dependent methyltransferase [Shuttleworthia satelles]
MACYESFAEIYDRFMDDVPYDRWRDHLLSIFKEYGIRSGLVAELGCGTGNMTERMAASGYDMTGIDRSTDMLQIAQEKQIRRLLSRESATDSEEKTETAQILYLCQDMRSFELYGTMAGIYAVCDAMNYLLTEEDLLTVLRLVNNYLDPGGVFIFDLVSEAAYRKMGERTIADCRDIGAFIWQNEFDEARWINHYDLEMFIREDAGELTVESSAESSSGKEQGTEEKRDAAGEGREERAYFRRHEEHVTRAYPVDRVICLIKESGLAFEKVLDAETMGEISDRTQRYYFVAREIAKAGSKDTASFRRWK